MMRRSTFAAMLVASAAIATPLEAQQPHTGHHEAEGQAPPDDTMERPVDHSQMDHGTQPAPILEAKGSVPPDLPPFTLSDLVPGEDHSAHAMAAPAGPPPAEAFEGPAHAAAAIYGAETMARARAESHATHGGMKTGTLMVERLEARIADGHDAYLWDLQGWYGGDGDKFVLKSEGEGEFGGSVEDAEIQALWGHAINPWFDLQAGARLDLEPETRSHLVLGLQGLLPYMWHVDAAAFLSDRGDLTARIEGEWDWKLTQRLLLQPRAELELAAQDVAERELGAGPTKLETGLRLRYEIAREFAPYVGVGYEARLGETADLARAAGEDPDGVALLIGLRAWF